MVVESGREWSIGIRRVGGLLYQADEPLELASPLKRVAWLEHTNEYGGKERRGPERSYAQKIQIILLVVMFMREIAGIAGLGGKAL